MNSRVKLLFWGQRCRNRIAPALVALMPVLFLTLPAGAAPVRSPLQLTIHKEFSNTSTFAPLEEVSVDLQPGKAGLRLRVKDAAGQSYVELNNVKTGQAFAIRGALGTHRLEVFSGGRVVLTRAFEVDASTALSCANPLYDGELRRLEAQLRAAGTVAIVDGQPVRMFSTEARESRYVNAAARYFESDLKSGLAIYLKSQKEDGSLYSAIRADDHFDPFTKTFPGVSLARDMFGGDFTTRTTDGRWVFERTPTSADVESMAVAWAHDVWQATGDDGWLASVLPKLDRALAYLQTDPLRWSTELQLIKRAFTLDVWGFQHPLTAKLQPGGGVNKAGWWDGFWVTRETPMGIAHGDNTAFYEAATLLARMHAYLGQQDGARLWTQAAERLRGSLDKSSWNGTFYRHYVRLVENPVWQQLQANESRQLSMSNPLAIVRGATTHAQAVSIISEYARRREKNKGTALAEWSTMDPPFKNGFGPWAASTGPNGSISPIVAGPLALAAFEHGAETYGADVFRRLFELQKRHGGLYGFYYPMARPVDWQPEEFQAVDLKTVANRHLRGDQPAGFIDHPNNDLRAFPVGRQTFLGKPFSVIDPKDNGGRAAVVLWGAGSPGPRETTVAAIRKKARSIYFLHSAGNIRRQSRVGEYVVNYTDGSKVRIPLVVDRNIGSWWSEGSSGEWRVAWRGENPHVSNVAIGIWGWENNQPEKEIDSITIRASGSGRVQLLGITLSTGPVQYERGEVESEASAEWSAGVVYAAAMAGLAGVVDRDRLLDHVTLSPRWLATGETTARVTVRYAASRSYLAYKWEHRLSDHTQAMTFSGSGRRFDFHMLMPAGAKPKSVTLNGRKLRYRTEVVEGSTYADFSLEGQTSGFVQVAF